MSELGNVRSVGNAMRANNPAVGKKANGRGTPNTSQSASSKAAAPGQVKSPALKKSIAAAEIAENLAERVISTVDERDKFIHAIDLSFGVEKPSYKNMWKVLKTVVKEIGVIKEANTGRFALGVTQRLDGARTLMEFTSLTDYLHTEMKDINEDAWEAHGTALANEAAEEAVSLKNTYGDISPHRVVFLLS